MSSNQVVPPDLGVAFGLDRQVQQAVAGELGEQVLEHAIAHRQLVFACAVQVDLNGYLGLGRVPYDPASSVRHSRISLNAAINASVW